MSERQPLPPDSRRLLLGRARRAAGPPTPSSREFPYRRQADEAVSRRHFLQLAIVTSGALFAGTVGFALLGRLDNRRRGSPQPIAPAAEVPVGEALYFEYPDEGDQAVLLQPAPGEFIAFSQKCTHLACSVYYQPERDRLFCPCHDGVFDPRNGEPTAGPPQRRLPQITLEVRDGVLYALEEVP
jgi:Rieske Fe-S protein